MIRSFASSVFVPTKTQNSFPAVTPESCFCLLVAPPPNPFSQNFILWLRTVPALFLPPPAEIFRKQRTWLTSIIANCPVSGNGIFSKIRQARRAAASVKRCSKGLGCFPTSKTCGSRRCRKPQVLCVCIYKRPACPVVKACTVRQPSTKFAPKALTGTPVCAWRTEYCAYFSRRYIDRTTAFCWGRSYCICVFCF